MKDSNFTKRVGAFASATLISRILGYVRDSLVAMYFGGGIQTDAFYSAFKIPNLLRRFLGEGSLTAAFVPVFTDTLHKKGKKEADDLLNSLISGLILVTSIIVILGIIFAPQVTKLVSWGFTSDPEKFDLTVQLTRLTFPFLMIITVAALATAVLNASGVFFIPAVAPSGLSIGEIAFIVFLASHVGSPIEGLAISAVVGVGIHLGWQLPSLYKEGYRLRFVKPFAHPQVKTVFLLMIPTVLGLCADQVNSFVDQLCASFLQDGAVSALYNSSRVMQMPLALFGVAVASVALPALSRSASENKDHEFKETLSFSLRIANFVLIPSMIGLVVLGLPIVQVLFQHGKFKPEYSLLTNQALWTAALGLPAFSAAKILASAFYAKKNTKTPMRVALGSMLINCILDILLMKKFGVAGLSFATTTAAWFQAIVLFLLLRKQIGLLDGRSILRSFINGCLMGAVMGLVSGGLTYFVLIKFHLMVRVFISIFVGTALYLSMAKMFKVKEFDYFMEALVHRKIKV